MATKSKEAQDKILERSNWLYQIESDAASRLAAALLHTKNPRVTAGLKSQYSEQFIAELFFDCLDAIEAKRKDRHERLSHLS